MGFGSAADGFAKRSVPRPDRGRIPVTVFCEDPLTQAGVVNHLQSEPLMEVGGSGRPVAGGVSVVVADRVDELNGARIRRLAQSQRVVLVVPRLREPELLRALDCRVAAIVLRNQATPERLVAAIRAAAQGDRDMPTDLVGLLVDVVDRLRHSEGSAVVGPHAPTERELDVLRLVAEGWETRAIAIKLAYSERTVKNVLHALTNRFQLRNRTHAVVYAIRAGFL